MVSYKEIHVNDRSKSVLHKNRVHKAASRVIEALEPRAYLTGVVLGLPNTLTVDATGNFAAVSPIFSTLADLTGNGNGDLIVTNQANSHGVSNSVSILLGQGNGTFNSALPQTIGVNGTPYPVTTGDFNGDGHMDIVVGTTGSPGDVTIILNSADPLNPGHFGTPTNIPALASNHALGVGNFITGGPLDVLAIDTDVSSTNNAVLLTGNGAGGATLGTPFSLPFGNVSAVGVGDFNGDGNLDFAVSNQLNNSVSVLLGNGNGTFQTAKTFPAGIRPTSILVDDFNGDGKMDIVTANSAGGDVSFLAGVGDGTFAAPVESVVGGTVAPGGPSKVRETHFTTGSKDLVVLDGGPGNTGDATVLLSNGNGTFHTGDIITTPHTSAFNAIAAGDLNSDLLTDVVLTNASQVTSLLNVTDLDTTPPTAAVDASQATPTATATSYDFTVTYTDTQQVDGASLNNNNLVVTFPGGATQNATLVSTNLGNNNIVHATYSIAFPSGLSTAGADNGTYTVSLGTTPATNADNKPVAAITPNTFVLNVPTVVTDTAPPTGAVDSMQAVGSTQSKTYNFTVTYTDNVAVNAATLATGNLIVTFPDNSTQMATFLSSGPTASVVQATYELTFSSNLTTNDIGSYPVSIVANSVKDTAGNAAVAANIGAIALTVSGTQPPPNPTGDFVPGAPFGKLVPAAVAGVTRQGGVRVSVTNGSVNTITGTLTITLYTSNSLIVDSSATALTFVTRKVRKLKPGKSFIVGFRPFKYPATAGLDHLVADVKLNGVADSFDGATATTVNVAAPFTDVKAVAATPNKTVAVAGKKIPVTLNVLNQGNIPFNGTATVDVFASLNGTLDGSQIQIAAGLPVHLNFRPGQSRNLHFNFAPITTPATGGYHLILTINVTGDTTTSNNTVASVATVSF